MFREIKFDIMHRIGEKEWKRVPAVEVKNNNGSLEAADSNNSVYQIDWESTYLLQSTGMFDKNALTIFHGHILKNKDDKYFEVFFGFGAFFIVDDLEKGDRVFLTDEIVRELEVAGDSFNNPELAVKPINEEEVINKIDEQNNANN